MSNKYNGPPDSSDTFGKAAGILRHAWETSQRAFVEFLNGDHILTTDLEAALSDLSTALTTHGQSQCSAAVVAALDQLKLSIGHLNSRSTHPGER